MVKVSTPPLSREAVLSAVRRLHDQGVVPTRGAIASALGSDLRRVDQMCGMMVQRGLLVRLTAGVYGVASMQEPRSPSIWHLDGRVVLQLGDESMLMSREEAALAATALAGMSPLHGPGWDGSGKTSHQLAGCRPVLLTIMPWPGPVKLEVGDDVLALSRSEAGLAAMGLWGMRMCNA